jgi:hypothetical protein
LSHVDRGSLFTDVTSKRLELQLDRRLLRHAPLGRLGRALALTNTAQWGVDRPAECQEELWLDLLTRVSTNSR